jgi:hypothetical protein
MSKIVSVDICGGLGNQLFKIAAAYAYSIKEGGTLQIIHKMANGDRPVYWDSILLRTKPFLVESIPSTLSVWHDPMCCTYTPIPPLTENGIYLNGYYQTSQFFYNDDIKQKIRTLFAPSSSLLNEVHTRYSYLMNHADRVIVVHARRTDYTIDQIKIDTHGPLSAEYYREAIKQMKTKVKDPIWLLTSDDNQYWTEIEIEKDIDSPIILMNELDINSFVLLQQFKNYIISNSTFIWWATWMADAQNVIAPSKWFGPIGPSNYNDIYEPHWERL